MPKQQPEIPRDRKVTGVKEKIRKLLPVFVCGQGGASFRWPPTKTIINHGETITVPCYAASSKGGIIGEAVWRVKVMQLS